MISDRKGSIEVFEVMEENVDLALVCYLQTLPPKTFKMLI